MTNTANNHYDVVVVGAGPSGSVLGYELARKGVRVLLLERDKLPRPKVCAGGITVRACSILPFDFSEIVESVLYGVRLSFKMKPTKMRVYEKPLAYMVMREKFDYLLARRAQLAGAEVRDGVKVESVRQVGNRVLVKTASEELACPVVIGADGANSAVVRSLGLQKGFQYGLGLNCHVAVNEQIHSQWDGFMGLDYTVPGGYGWVFPKRNCLAVGAGGPRRVVKTLKPRIMSLAKTYSLGPIDAGQIRGHMMPMKHNNTRLAHGRILLVGDAAGVIDPFSGEGIFYGVKSSLLALPAILNFLEKKSADMTEYDEAVKREITPELRTAWVIQKLNSVSPRLFFHYLEESDRVWRAFCGMLRGERTYVQLKNRLSLPLRLGFEIL